MEFFLISLFHLRAVGDVYDSLKIKPHIFNPAPWSVDIFLMGNFTAQNTRKDLKPPYQSGKGVG